MFGRDGRIAVQEDAEVVRLGTADDEVVVLRTLYIHQAEAGPFEVDSIVADQQVRRLRFRPTIGQILVFTRGVISAVIHQDLSVGLYQVVAPRAGVLQGFLHAEYCFPPDWFVEMQLGVREGVYEVGIYEELTARADVDGVHGCPLRCDRYDERIMAGVVYRFNDLRWGQSLSW